MSSPYKRERMEEEQKKIADAMDSHIGTEPWNHTSI